LERCGRFPRRAARPVKEGYSAEMEFPCGLAPTNESLTNFINYYNMFHNISVVTPSGIRCTAIPRRGQ
jgi:hypothetical protein